MSNEINSNSSTQGGMDGKTIAIISYITIIGWIIAYVMYGNNKSKLAIFHLRQSLFLMLCGIVIYIVQVMFLFIPVLGWIISILLGLVGLGLFVLWILGLVSAVNGEEKPVPVLGEKAQQILAGIK